MLLLYFETDKASFREQRFPFRGDFCQNLGLVKRTNCQYLSQEAENEKNESTLLSQTFKLFSFLASRSRYWQFGLLTSTQF